MTWSEDDLKQMTAHGVSPIEINRQMQLFKSGNTKIMLHAACDLNEGIHALSDAAFSAYVELFEAEQKNLNICKFVPASGAASRMFQFLFESNSKEKQRFQENMDDFPFSRLWESSFGKSLSENADEAISFLLSEKGLNYADKPKGMIDFHRYPSGELRTAFEEHIFEGCEYAFGKNKVLHLHFTVAPKYLEQIQSHLDKAWEKSAHRNNFEVNFELSVQENGTDTIAVNDDLSPYRDEEGQLVFRPGGHGALIHNLNSIDADLIFIKNIDNVLPQYRSKQSHDYKKALGGLTLSLQADIHALLERFSDPQDQEVCEDAKRLIQRWFSLGEIPCERKGLIQVLERPLRVCGMVANLGEPGGGPFWVKQSDGRITPQIIEKAQINLEDQEQLGILQSSTHFNPVDIVCAKKDVHQEAFDLLQFVDPNAHFIANKSIRGKAIKALEHPGLWNGGMSHWNTVFVEVPIETFSPVKTVNDLLRQEHQCSL
jgi:hypothetical protein